MQVLMVIMTLPLDVGLEVLLVMMHPMRVLVVLLLVLMIYLLLVVFHKVMIVPVAWLVFLVL